MTQEILDQGENYRNSIEADLKNIFSDIENLVKSNAWISGQNSSEVRTELLQKCKVLRENIRKIQEDGKVKIRATMSSLDDYVHENPWQTAAISFGVGVLLGALISR